MDYSFSQYYFGRSEYDGILSRQIAPGYGQLMANTNQYFNLRLMSLNAMLRLPADNVPVSVFVSGAAGFQRNSPALLNVSEGEITTSYLWSGGFIVHAFPGIMDIYVPVYVNEPNPNLLTKKGKFNIWKNVMFSLNIPAMNPFNLVTKTIAR